MTDIKKTLKKIIDFEEDTKAGVKSKTILIQANNKDIPVKVITKVSL